MPKYSGSATRRFKSRHVVITSVLAATVLVGGVALASTGSDADNGRSASESDHVAAGKLAEGPSAMVKRPPTPKSTPTTATPEAKSSPRSTTEPETTSPSPRPTKTASPTPTESANPKPTATEAAADFPTMETTGPDVALSSLKPSDSVTTDENGQVIEGLNITSRLKIVNDDVTVRNVRINHTATKSGQYALHITKKSNGECPENVVLENIEIVGDTEVLVDTAKTVYSECPFTLRDSRIYDVGNGIRITKGAHIEGNYILNNHFVPGSGSHRGGVALNGGSNHVIAGNTIQCEGTGCSGALVMYGDFAPISDVLIENNLLNTTGSYCTYGGSLDSKEYPKATHVRYIDNHFGRKYFDTCGRYGPRAGWDGSNEGNVWTGNVWHDTGEEIP